jgi:hypothetical protein
VSEKNAEKELAQRRDAILKNADNELAQRRDSILKRMLETPPKPHKTQPAEKPAGCKSNKERLKQPKQGQP